MLGQDWAWLAEDGAFSVPDDFVLNAYYFRENNKWVCRSWSPRMSQLLMEKNGYSLFPSSLLLYEEKLFAGEFMGMGGATITHEYWETFTYAPQNNVYWWKSSASNSTKAWLELDGTVYINKGAVMNYEPGLLEKFDLLPQPACRHGNFKIGLNPIREHSPISVSQVRSTRNLQEIKMFTKDEHDYN